MNVVHMPTRHRSYNKVYLTEHAKERCNRRGFAVRDVVAECRRMPRVVGETTWDNGIFKMKVKGDGRSVVVITVFKTDKRIRSKRRTKKVRV